MRLSTRQEIDAPIDQVFETLAQFDEFEAIARRRGIDVCRREGTRDQRLGAAWDVRAEVFGKSLDMELLVTRFEPETSVVIDLTSRGFAGDLRCDLAMLSAERTALTCAVEMRPQTFSAKLLLKPLALAQDSVNEKFGRRVGEIVREIEAGLKANG